jgi:methylmalonyl-CoA/ethylmalonyl-CoA epimerase
MAGKARPDAISFRIFQKKGKYMPKRETDSFKIRPHHCGISVPDLEASIAWYRDMLGFSVVKRLTLDTVPAKIAFIRHGDFLIELFEIAGATPLPEDRRYPDRDICTHGTKHIAFAAEDVHKFVDSLKKRGVDIAMDVNMVENKAMAFIRDNAGNLIEINEVGSP